MKKILFLFFFFIYVPPFVFGQNLIIHDDLNRVSSVKFENGITIEYCYDELGNRTCQIITKKILVKAKLFIEGAFDNANNLMNDDLRLTDELPNVEPFGTLGFNHVIDGGNESINDSILSISGNNAIVDWVFVELRDKVNATNILATRSGLLQRDGDIVDTDGVSPLKFPSLPTDNYFIAIRHRNHLGVRTANPILPNHEGVLVVDFSDPMTPTFGTNARKVFSGIAMLYAGNANHDSQINAVDKNSYWRIQNGQTFNYLSSIADFNLDGAVNAVDKNLYWRINNSIIEQLD